MQMSVTLSLGKQNDHGTWSLKLQQSFPDKQNMPVYETKIPNTVSVSCYSEIYFSKQDPNK